jgi:hypothetical protein
MIHIDFNPAQLTGAEKVWWDAWQAGAEAAILEVIKSWEADRTMPINFNDQIWGNLKDWLLRNVFHEKCAYCETPLLRSSMHAEHYRPKGGVKYRQEGQKKLQQATAQDGAQLVIDHPGYFWLAYDWRNLLPSCAYCNSNEGKLNQFPILKTFVLLKPLQPAELAGLHEAPIESKIWPGYYYLKPADLDDLEGPELLHPYYDDPAQHLGFGIKGIEFALEDTPGVVSPKGDNSIKVYNLSDARLREARFSEQQKALLIFGMAFTKFTAGGMSKVDALQQAWQDPEIIEYVNGVKPYSAAVVACIRYYYPQ